MRQYKNLKKNHTGGTLTYFLPPTEYIDDLNIAYSERGTKIRISETTEECGFIVKTPRWRIAINIIWCRLSHRSRSCLKSRVSEASPVSYLSAVKRESRISETYFRQNRWFSLYRGYTYGASRFQVPKRPRLDHGLASGYGRFSFARSPTGRQ